MAVGIAAAVVITFLGARHVGLIAPSPGPLDAPGGQAGTRAAGHGTVTAIFSLNDSGVEDPVELRSARVVGADPNLDVGAPRMIVCKEGTTCVYPHFATRSLSGRATLEDVDGYVMDGSGNTLVAVPVRVPAGPGSYDLRGLRLDYTAGLRRFRAAVGPRMTFTVREKDAAR